MGFAVTGSYNILPDGRWSRIKKGLSNSLEPSPREFIKNIRSTKSGDLEKQKDEKMSKKSSAAAEEIFWQETEEGVLDSDSDSWSPMKTTGEHPAVPPLPDADVYIEPAGPDKYEWKDTINLNFVESEFVEEAPSPVVDVVAVSDSGPSLPTDLGGEIAAAKTADRGHSVDISDDKKVYIVFLDAEGVPVKPESVYTEISENPKEGIPASGVTHRFDLYPLVDGSIYERVVERFRQMVDSEIHPSESLNSASYVDGKLGMPFGDVLKISASFFDPSGVQVYPTRFIAYTSDKGEAVESYSIHHFDFSDAIMPLLVEYVSRLFKEFVDSFCIDCVGAPLPDARKVRVVKSSGGDVA